MLAIGMSFARLDGKSLGRQLTLKRLRATPRARLTTGLGSDPHITLLGQRKVG